MVRNGHLFQVRQVICIAVSADLEEELMDQEVVVLEEVQQLADPGHMLACGDRDIFNEETYTFS